MVLIQYLTLVVSEQLYETFLCNRSWPIPRELPGVACKFLAFTVYASACVHTGNNVTGSILLPIISYKGPHYSTEFFNSLWTRAGMWQSEFRFRKWLVTWCHQVIFWTSIDLSSVRFSNIHFSAFFKIKISLKMISNFIQIYQGPMS